MQSLSEWYVKELSTFFDQFLRVTAYERVECVLQQTLILREEFYKQNRKWFIQLSNYPRYKPSVNL